MVFRVSSFATNVQSNLFRLKKNISEIYFVDVLNRVAASENLRKIDFQMAASDLYFSNISPLDNLLDGDADLLPLERNFPPHVRLEEIDFNPYFDPNSTESIRREFLISVLKLAFRELKCPARTQHRICETGIDYESEHTCSEEVHLQVLLTSMLERTSFMMWTSTAMMTAIQFQGTPVAIYISPTGTMITATEGRGYSTHPLTRLIFWKVFLKFYPYYGVITGAILQLQEDLIRSHFMIHPENSITGMLRAFRSMICLSCLRLPTYHRLSIRDPFWTQEYPVYCCRKDGGYRFHLLILGILRNEWKGTTINGNSYTLYQGFPHRIELTPDSLIFGDEPCSTPTTCFLRQFLSIYYEPTTTTEN